MSRLLLYRMTYEIGNDADRIHRIERAIDETVKNYKHLRMEKCWNWVDGQGRSWMAIRMIGVV
jgi:hypothetical protein